jgi:hypothetical protein
MSAIRRAKLIQLIVGSVDDWDFQNLVDYVKDEYRTWAMKLSDEQLEERCRTMGLKIKEEK